MRRATHAGKPGLHVADISIHALHEESDASFDGVERHVRISIHALHEESDKIITTKTQIWNISIHALHEESDRHI